VSRRIATSRRSPARASLSVNTRAVLACLLLQYGVLVGMPVRKDELEELQRALHRPVQEQIQTIDEP
jgi:hypothetical protein